MKASNTSSILGEGKLLVGYSQVQVRYAHLAPNDWNAAHVRQGFAWRPGSVSFATLAAGGPMHVYVELSHQWSPRPDAMRCVRVPFTVDRSSQTIVVATTDSSEKDFLSFTLAEDIYNLIFEHGRQTTEDEDMWSRFVFVRGPLLPAQVIAADAALAPPHDFLMSANSVSDESPVKTNDFPSKIADRKDSTAQNVSAESHTAKITYLDGIGLRQQGISPERIVQIAPSFDLDAIERICDYLKSGRQPREAAGAIWGFFRDYPQAEKFFSELSLSDQGGAIAAMSIRDGQLARLPETKLAAYSPDELGRIDQKSFDEADKVRLLLFFYAVRRLKAKSYLLDFESRMIEAYRSWLQNRGEISDLL